MYVRSRPMIFKGPPASNSNRMLMKADSWDPDWMWWLRIRIFKELPRCFLCKWVPLTWTLTGCVHFTVTERWGRTKRWNTSVQVTGLVKGDTGQRTKGWKESQRPQSNEVNEDQNWHVQGHQTRCYVIWTWNQISCLDNAHSSFLHFICPYKLKVWKH